MRRSAATLFLLIILLNGVLELLCALQVPSLMRLKAAASQPVGTSCEEPAASACCASKPPPPPANACGCRCCGPVCSMGSRCTCNAPKGALPAGRGVFIAQPGCGPFDLSVAHYVPPSLGFFFLLPGELTVAGHPTEESWSTPGARRPFDVPRTPLSPPPEAAAFLPAV